MVRKKRKKNEETEKERGGNDIAHMAAGNPHIHSHIGMVSVLRENTQGSFAFDLPRVCIHGTPSDSCFRPFHSSLAA